MTSWNGTTLLYYRKEAEILETLNLKQYKPAGVKHRSRHILLYAIDILTIICAAFLVYWFFLEGKYDSNEWFVHSAVLALTVLLVRIIAGVYVFVWRYASAINYLTLCLSDLFAGVAFMPLSV